MRQSSSKSAQGGVALIEAMVAIFIFSIGVLAVIGMQAVSIRTAADAKYRADAAFLADQIIGQMWSDQGTGPTPPAPDFARPSLTAYNMGVANCGSDTAVTATSTTARGRWLQTVASTLPGADVTRQRIQYSFTAATSAAPAIHQVTVTVCWLTAPGATDYHNHVITTRINNNG